MSGRQSCQMYNPFWQHRSPAAAPQAAIHAGAACCVRWALAPTVYERVSGDEGSQAGVGKCRVGMGLRRPCSAAHPAGEEEAAKDAEAHDGYRGHQQCKRGCLAPELQPSLRGCMAKAPRCTRLCKDASSGGMRALPGLACSRAPGCSQGRAAAGCCARCRAAVSCAPPPSPAAAP